MQINKTAQKTPIHDTENHMSIYNYFVVQIYRDTLVI
jgi:hypothetical protein